MKDEGKTKKQLIDELVDLRQRATELETLYAVAQAASQTPKLDNLLNNTLKKMIDAMDIDTGLIYLMDASEKTLMLKARWGIPKQVAAQISVLRLEDEEFQEMLQWKNSSIFFSEIFFKTTLNQIADAMVEAQAQSFAAVPFSGKDELLGVMIAGSRSSQEFSLDRMKLLESVSNQIGISAESAMRFEEISRLATTDELTGVYNHYYFQQRLEEEIARSSRYGQKCSLIIIDLDHFRVYNDLFGHMAGDKVLKKVGGLLRKCARQIDIVCRYSGSGFTIILPQTDADAAYSIAQRLQQVAEAALLEESTISDANLTFSLGIASFPGDGPSPDGLIHRADIALATAKQRGRNQACLASDVLNVTTSPKRALWEVAEYLEAASASNIYAMAAAVDARDHCTYMHSRNVSKYAVTMGKVISLPRKKIERLRIAALLHDIGKIGVSDSIIKKPGPLNEKEWEMMKKHPELGAIIINHIPELADCAAAVRHHHEHYDGNGYPDGLKEKDIPIEARIIAIAEAYDNMTTPRSYHQAISHEQAVEELKQHANSQFDPSLVLAFIHAAEQIIPH